jgi:hypothetical protein
VKPGTVAATAGAVNSQHATSKAAFAPGGYRVTKEHSSDGSSSQARLDSVQAVYAAKMQRQQNQVVVGHSQRGPVYVHDPNVKLSARAQARLGQQGVQGQGQQVKNQSQQVKKMPYGSR